MVDFWGVVRALEDGKEITGIEYEAHREMAEHQMRGIAESAASKFGLAKVVDPSSDRLRSGRGSVGRCPGGERSPRRRLRAQTNGSWTS